MVRRSLLETRAPANVLTDFVAYQYSLRVPQPMPPYELSLYVQISIVSHYEQLLKPLSRVLGIFFKFDVEPARLSLIHRMFLILHPVRHHPIRVFSPSISVVAGQEDTGSIAPLASMLPYSPYSPATSPLSGCTSLLPGTPTGIGLSPGLFAPARAADGGIRTR
jgi:hypothetical protein